MNTARHQISGLEVSAQTALDDRDLGWVRFRPPGFVCCHCKWPAGLRRRGRGDEPFFFHYAHSPRNCPRLTEGDAEGEWEAGNDGSPRAASLADVLFDEVKMRFVTALGRGDPRQIELQVVKFLSFGIQRRNHYRADDRMSVLVSNMLQTLYQPQYIVLLRWICARVASQPGFTGASEPFWETIQEEFLSSDIAQSWYDCVSPDSVPISPVIFPTTRLISHGINRLLYSSFYGSMNCFKLNHARVDIAEICEYPTTLVIQSHSRMQIGIARCQQGSTASIGEITLHQDECRLTLSEPEAIILSPNYEFLETNIQLRPFLYLLPGVSR